MCLHAVRSVNKGCSGRIRMFTSDITGNKTLQQLPTWQDLSKEISCGCKSSKFADVWKKVNSLTITTPVSVSFSIFLPLCFWVWMCSIRSWNMLLHSEWVNLYVTASRVGSSFDGEPRLICLWLQRGLRHASCPCSALINGSGERKAGEKVCVCVCETSPKTLGFRAA